MSDELDDISPIDGKGYIVNLDSISNHKPSDKNLGTHWVCISNFRKNSISYFDSFGFPPNEACLRFMRKAYTGNRIPDKRFIQLEDGNWYTKKQKFKKPPLDLSPKRKTIIYNTDKIQNSNSDDCGYYACYVLEKLFSYNLPTIIENFDLFHTWKNDKFVEKRIKNILVGIKE